MFTWLVEGGRVDRGNMTWYMQHIHLYMLELRLINGEGGISWSISHTTFCFSFGNFLFLFEYTPRLRIPGKDLSFFFFFFKLEFYKENKLTFLKSIIVSCFPFENVRRNSYKSYSFHPLPSILCCQMGQLQTEHFHCPANGYLSLVFVFQPR